MGDYEKYNNLISCIRNISLSNLTIGDVYDLIQILSTDVFSIKESEVKLNKILKNIKCIRKE